jgi:hypothetical protein
MSSARCCSGRVRRKGAPAREVERARIVLLAPDGVPGVEIAERVGCSEPTVIRWRSSNERPRLEGPLDPDARAASAVSPPGDRGERPADDQDAPERAGARAVRGGEREPSGRGGGDTGRLQSGAASAWPGASPRGPRTPR